MRLYRAAAAAFAALGLLACTPDPEVSPPPPEQRYVSPLPPPLGPLVEMRQSDAERYIVQGVGPAANETSRWAKPYAVLEFLAFPFVKMKFHMRFTLPEKLFAARDAVLLSVSVNGEQIVESAYQRPGEYKLDEPVDQALPWDQNSRVEIRLVSQGGPPLPEGEPAFLLTSAGFYVP